MVVAALEMVGGGDGGRAPFALLYDMNRLLGVLPPALFWRLCDELESEGRRCGCKAEMGEQSQHHNGLSFYNPQADIFTQDFFSFLTACVYLRDAHHIVDSV